MLNSRSQSHFFGRRRSAESDEDYIARMREFERMWEHLMEEQFQLKEYAKLNLFEQAEMTSEERAWWLKRTQKEIEERNKKESEASSGASRSLPSMPSMPSISLPGR